MNDVASTDSMQVRKWNRAIYLLTAVVWVLVLFMRSPYKIPVPPSFDSSVIPPINALLNTTVSLLLISALIAIKAGRRALHQKLMTSAMGVSAVFLLLYVAYHFTTEAVKYGGEGLGRSVYLTILFSHIVLAAVSLPFILKMWAYGYLGLFDRHKKLGRIVFPMWLYVAVTGPVCYLFLRPYY